MLCVEPNKATTNGVFWSIVRNVELLLPFGWARLTTGGGIGSIMDAIVFIMFGSVLCTVMALNFMELRRIRKKLESKP